MTPTSVARAHVVFVFAHQDDEIGAAPWIEKEVRDDNRVSCVFLTDGARRTCTGVRDAESIGVLSRIGVRSEDVSFLLAADRIPDNELNKNLSRASQALERWLDARAPDVGRMYSLAWEGGHPDHDAAHILTLLSAQRRRIDDAWQFSLYNGRRCRTFFRVLSQLPARADARELRYDLRDGWRYAVLCWSFPSQRRTWLGLFPELFFRRVFLRREFIVRFDVDRALERPHEGPLLYERMFGTSYKHVEALIAPLREELRLSRRRSV